MLNRTIRPHTRGGAQQLADVLASLFALELAAPGGRLYVIAPRLADVPLLVSPFGQFRALMPELGRTELRLAEALALLAARGAVVRVMCQAGDAQARAFLEHLDPGVGRRSVARLAERGLIGERFCLRGSLAFTVDGISSDDPRVELTTDAAEISRALVEAEQLWRHGA